MADHDSIRKKPDSIKIYLLLGLAISLFLYNDTVRMMLNNSEINTKLNLLFILIGVLTIGYMFFKENIDLRIILLAFAFAGLAFIAMHSVSGGLSRDIKTIATVFMPLLIIGFRIPKVDFIPFLKKFMQIFNVVCILVVVLGIIDYFSNAGIQDYFIQRKLFSPDVIAMIYYMRPEGVYRYCSVIGHTLTVAWYLLAFYMLNILYNRYFGPLLNDYLLVIITLIGLLLTGSRSALIIGLLMFVLLNNSKNKILYLSFTALFGAGLFSTALFKQNMMQRFIVNSAAGDVSEGRNLAFEYVLKGFIKQPAWITGGGLDSSYQITKMLGFIKSFEYPFIMLAYDLGIISTMLIYLLILLIPVYIFMKNRNYRILVFFMLISVYINGYNGLANYSDFMGQFCFITMILINISYIVYKKKEGAIIS